MNTLTSASLLILSTLAASSPKPTAELVFQYDTPTWIENFAVRRNGQILPARATSAVLTQLDLRTGRQETIANKSSVGSAIMGITEVSPDLYAMSTMYCDLSTLSCTPGTGNTWSVDLRHADAPRVRRLVEGPRERSLLNGMAALNERTLLMVDQALGGIWAVDMAKGGADLVIQVEAMEDPHDQGNGVNGIRVRGETLYFNNPSLGTFCSVPIDRMTGRKTGDVRVISTGLEPDDFEIDERRGVAYLTNGPENTLLRIDLETGEYEVVVRDLPGPTSARWIDRRERALCVSTTGGYPQWLNGNATVGGAIYKVKLPR